MHGQWDSFSNITTITPSDTVQQHFAAILCLATGNIVLRGFSSTADVTITGVAAGILIPIETQFVKATGTTGSWGGLA